MAKNNSEQVKIEHLFINLTFINQNFYTYFSRFQKEFLELKNDYHLAIKTIYIATNDSIFLSNKELKLFLNFIKSIVTTDLIEYSFEIGYQNMTRSQLKILKNLGINRLVWKVRTFNQKLLSNIDNNFNVKEMLSLIKASLIQGFDNFSFELEDNIALQSKEDIIADLKIALAFDVKHISYQSHDDYLNLNNKKLIAEYLNPYDYNNYEFFSFALHPKNYSQQTLAYLQLKNWYGLGPNAGSFIYSDNKTVILNNNNEVNWTKKVTTLSYNEYYQLLITQGLLLKSGIKLENDCLTAFEKFSAVINDLITQNQLSVVNNRLKATNKGWVSLNDIIINIMNG